MIANWFRLLAGLFLLPCAVVRAEVIAAGAGSYTTERPAGTKGPPATIYKTDRVRGKMPSNDWWSSLAWASNAFAHYPHPLAVKTEPAGLRIAYPGANITANAKGIFGTMPGGMDDFILGHSAQTNFSKPLVDGFSDWFVDVLFKTDESISQGLGTDKDSRSESNPRPSLIPGKNPPPSLRVSYGHGSPFVYALYTGGTPRLVFSSVPRVWSGDAQSATLGVTVNGRHFGLFAPGGSTWRGLGTKEFICDNAGKEYFSVAVLPDNDPATLERFRRVAHAHVTDTRIEWSYDTGSRRGNEAEGASAAKGPPPHVGGYATLGDVTTTFRFTTKVYEGDDAGTLFALYPHQWRNTAATLLPASYNSVRGAMKLAQGNEFTTRMKFPGVLPALPDADGRTAAQMQPLIDAELNRVVTPAPDTYWNGKQLGKLATLIPIAELYGLTNAAGTLRERLRTRLEDWFRATDTNGAAKVRTLFHYDERVGTLIGYPASYGSDTELNDHHFHYGYFIKADAEIARHDPAWASDARWGAMVKLLIRDVVSPDRADAMFPFLRCFDPYAGHSWASGTSHFPDGNNNESSSEAMNAWTGLILWAEATGDRALRDLGVFLFTTEMNAIQEYWFDVRDENHPPAFTASVATMIWGGKSVNETWFTADPQLVHGINWLPMHGGSLYLGHFPAYAEKNYRALVAEHKGGDQFTNWPDLAWMYRALSDPADAIRLYEAADLTRKIEDGNSLANVAHWIYNLNALGKPDRSYTADYPAYAVFNQAGVKAYVVWNLADAPLTVTFSDGTKVNASKRGPAVMRRSMKMLR